MKKMFLGMLMLAFCASSLALLWNQEKTIHDELVEQMKTQESFTGEEVDRLWHWKNEHWTSEEFKTLYNKKIKDLPGWHYGE